jgi:hypothetical protein
MERIAHFISNTLTAFVCRDVARPSNGNGALRCPSCALRHFADRHLNAIADVCNSLVAQSGGLHELGEGYSAPYCQLEKTVSSRIFASRPAMRGTSSYSGSVSSMSRTSPSTVVVAMPRSSMA